MIDSTLQSKKFFIVRLIKRLQWKPTHKKGDLPHSIISQQNEDQQYFVPLHCLKDEFFFRIDQQTEYLVITSTQSLRVKPQMFQIDNSISNSSNTLLLTGNVLHQEGLIAYPQTQHPLPTNPQTSSKQVHDVSGDTK